MDILKFKLSNHWAIHSNTDDHKWQTANWKWLNVKEIHSYIKHKVSLKKTLMLGKIEGRKRRGQQRMNDWMASLTQWTWVWASSGRQGRTGKPGMLLFLGSQRVRHDLVTEQQQKFNRGINRKSRRLRGKQKDYRNILFGGTRHRATVKGNVLQRV